MTSPHIDFGTHTSWRGMRDRVSKRHGVYTNVDMDPRWNSLESFVQDMGLRPNGMEIDRIDGTKGYWPDNCRWADAKTQSRNRSNTYKLSYDGFTGTLSEWAERLGLNYWTLYARVVKYKWPIERALVPELERQQGA